MKIKLLDGTTTNLVLHKYKVKHNGRKQGSKFQTKIWEQLKREFPNDNIFEEVFIPKERFVLDFFIPSIKIVIECQGRQHKEHVKFFHTTKKDFHNQIDRDLRKKEWCNINGFKLIEIDYDSS